MLRFLLIDDNPDDRFLITRELHRGFSDVHIEPIIDAVTLCKALNHGNFDLVITDYRLQWNDGLTVLREIKFRYPDCPVVMFTDSGSEEIAVAAMKLGLDDYLTKSSGHYSRLPLVVRSVLQRTHHITERKRAEVALLQSEERLRLALDAAYMGIWDWDLQTNHTTWTDSNERLFGLAPGTFGGKFEEFLERVHPDDRAQVLHQIERSLQDHIGYQQEYRIVYPNGQIRWIAGKGEFVFDQVGQPVRMVGTSIDITPRKEAELALQALNNTLDAQVRERTAQLQQALEFDKTLKRITDKVRDSLDEHQILQTAVQELGEGLGVNSCNVALYDLNDRTSTICYEYNPSPFPVKGTVSRIDNYREIYQRLMNGECTQFCNLLPNPIRGRVTMLACPMFDDQDILGDLWLIVDKEYAFREPELRLVQQVATQCAIALRQARLYQAAQRQVEELEKLNRLKDDFLNTVSHELRTPITSIKIAVQMLKMAPTEESRQRYLTILQTECDREVSLINDLLDLQKLENSAPLNETTDQITLQNWLPSLLTPFQVRARKQKQLLEVDIPPTLCPLKTDQKRLERILSELLNNACKYTSGKGKIRFNVQSTPAAASEPCAVQFTVSNQADIPPSELPRIFDKFYRIPNSDPWKQGGTGLGLALVQKLTEQLGGTIEAISQEGWTTLTVKLPSNTKNGGDRPFR